MVSEIRYGPYTPGPYAESQLAAEVAAAGLPAPSGVYGSGFAGPGTLATSILVGFAAALTAGQQATLGTVVAAHVPAKARVPRLFLDVLTDLNALTNQQKKNITDYLFGARPAKWEKSAGPHQPAMNILVASNNSLTPAQQMVVAAAHCIDNPAVFVNNPAVDATVNVSGDQPTP